MKNIHPRAPPMLSSHLTTHPNHPKQFILPYSSGTKSWGGQDKKRNIIKGVTRLTDTSKTQESEGPVGFALKSALNLNVARRGTTWMSGVPKEPRSTNTHCLGQFLVVQAGLVQNSRCKIRRKKIFVCICTCVSIGR